MKGIVIKASASFGMGSRHRVANCLLRQAEMGGREVDEIPDGVPDGETGSAHGAQLTRDGHSEVEVLKVRKGSRQCPCRLKSLLFFCSAALRRSEALGHQKYQPELLVDDAGTRFKIGSSALVSTLSRLSTDLPLWAVHRGCEWSVANHALHQTSSTMRLLQP